MKIIQPTALHLLLPALLALSGVLPGIASEPVRVKFKAGESGTRIDGSITGYDFVDYLVGASKGQRMAVELDTKHLSTFFLVFGPGADPGEDEAIFRGQVTGNEFIGTLPESGDYTIRVAMMRNAARRDETANFSLDIGIGSSEATPQNAPSASTGEPQVITGYQLGYARGVEDGWGGLSRTPDRYENLYSEADRGEFSQGYEDGYNFGIKLPTPSKGFQIGYSSGLEDGASGQSRTPDRHPEAKQADFSEGYEAGYNKGIK